MWAWDESLSAIGILRSRLECFVYRATIAFAARIKANSTSDSFISAEISPTAAHPRNVTG